jgi:hypothetical protein
MNPDRICRGLLVRGGASETLPAGPSAGDILGSVKDPPCTDELGGGSGMSPPASAGAGADSGGMDDEYSWFTVIGGSVSRGTWCGPAWDELSETTLARLIK